jgi:hypothetical protein
MERIGKYWKSPSGKLRVFTKEGKILQKMADSAV